MSVRPNVHNARKTAVVSLFGGLWNNVLDGCKRFVSGSNLWSDIILVKDMKCSVLLIPWYPVSRTRHETEQLRAREDKVKDLRQEKQQERLREMGLNSDDRKCHPCNITEGVTREGTCRIPGDGILVAIPLNKQPH
jgi:hypothetical protein